LDTKDTETFWIERYENVLNRKIRKRFGYQRYLSDPKDTKKTRKPSGSKIQRTTQHAAWPIADGRWPMAAARRRPYGIVAAERRVMADGLLFKQ
jgi:hypothetical protein